VTFAPTLAENCSATRHDANIPCRNEARCYRVRVQTGADAMTANHLSVSNRHRGAFTASCSAADLSSRFLQGLTQPERESVLAAAKERRLRANSIVTNQGDPADSFFVLTKGCARHFFTTEEGQEILVFWFTVGDVFGGSALLPEPWPYLLSTEVVEDSCALVWRRSEIRDLVARYPRLQENALSIASEYLAWFHASHTALISHTDRGRVGRVLTSLAQSIWPYSSRRP
jgi:CRP-like cAMP-binding protein